MDNSLSDRINAEDFELIKQNVYYDPSAEYGLRWASTCFGRSHRGHCKDEPTGRVFFIGQKNYQSSWIVLILHNIWPESANKVVTRVDPSRSWGSVDNLMWVDRCDAAKRNRDHARIAYVRSVLGDSLPSLDDRHRLGKPCKRNHQWNDHPLSLYTKHGSSWRCKQCQSLRWNAEKQRPKRREQRKAYGRAYYLANAEKVKERQRRRRDRLTSEQLQSERAKARDAKRRRRLQLTGLELLALPSDRVLNRREHCAIQRLAADGHPLNWPYLEPLVIELIQTEMLYKSILEKTGRCPSVAKLVMEEQHRYWREHPEAKKEHMRRWHKSCWWLKYQTKPELRLYTRQKSKRRKAQMRDSVAIHVTGNQIRVRFAQFDNRCAYCGVNGDLHIEHVIPISKGGPHAIGNIIPACKDCNYSKSVHDVESWYRAQPFFNELRWGKICRMLNWQRSSVGQLALL